MKCYMIGISQDSGEEGRWYKKWIDWIFEAMSCLDTESVSWKFLPGAGGYYEQDDLIMEVWEMIRVSYMAAKTDPEIKAYFESKVKKNANS